MPCSSMLVMENRSLLFSACKLELVNLRKLLIHAPFIVALPLTTPFSYESSIRSPFAANIMAGPFNLLLTINIDLLLFYNCYNSLL